MCQLVCTEIEEKHGKRCEFSMWVVSEGSKLSGIGLVIFQMDLSVMGLISCLGIAGRD